MINHLKIKCKENNYELRYEKSLSKEETIQLIESKNDLNSDKIKEILNNNEQKSIVYGYDGINFDEELFIIYPSIYALCYDFTTKTFSEYNAYKKLQYQDKYLSLLETLPEGFVSILNEICNVEDIDLFHVSNDTNIYLMLNQSKITEISNIKDNIISYLTYFNKQCYSNIVELCNKYEKCKLNYIGFRINDSGYIEPKISCFMIL